MFDSVLTAGLIALAFAVAIILPGYVLVKAVLAYLEAASSGEIRPMTDEEQLAHIMEDARLAAERQRDDPLTEYFRYSGGDLATRFGSNSSGFDHDN